jgi:hypothetical protein
MVVDSLEILYQEGYAMHRVIKVLGPNLPPEGIESPLIAKTDRMGRPYEVEASISGSSITMIGRMWCALDSTPESVAIALGLPGRKMPIPPAGSDLYKIIENGATASGETVESFVARVQAENDDRVSKLPKSTGSVGWGHRNYE